MPGAGEVLVRRRLNQGGMMLRAIAALALAAGIPAGDLQAQATPEDAARAFGEAVRHSDWPAAARLMHPDAVHQLRLLFQPIVSAPGMESLRSELFGAQSDADFARLADTVLFARFLENAIAKQEGMGEALRSATVTPLGHVPQGADTMLVVTRTNLSVEGIAIRTFEVMPFVRYQGRWRGVLKAEFTNMAAMLQRAMAKRS
jgi:hypothetical protein